MLAGVPSPPIHRKYGSPRGPVPMVGERCVSQRSPRHGLLAVRMGVDWSPDLISRQSGIFSGQESAVNSPGRAHQAIFLCWHCGLSDIWPMAEWDWRGPRPILSDLSPPSYRLSDSSLEPYRVTQSEIPKVKYPKNYQRNIKDYCRRII